MKNHGCAAERFDQILKDYGLPKGAPEPKRIHASQIMPSPFNRLGRPLNQPYIQHNLLPSIGGGPGQSGFQNKRPNPGFVARRTDPEKLERLHDHVMCMISQAPHLWPKYKFGPDQYKECVGGNHLSVALNMLDQGFVSPLSGFRCTVQRDGTNPHLATNVDDGQEGNPHRGL